MFHKNGRQSTYDIIQHPAMTEQELQAMTLEERIAYLKRELGAAQQERNAPDAVNVFRLTAAQRADLKRDSREVVNDFADTAVFMRKRLARYSHTTSSEDYSATESQTQPNASMTIEAIYKRVSQGKPISDTNLMDMTSKRDVGYDSDVSTRAESLDALWREPFEQPEGTLERMQEMSDRYRKASEALAAAQQRMQQQQQQQQEPTQNPSEVTTGSYEEQRKAAKASKQTK